MRNRTESEWLQKRKGKEEREKEARGRKREREQERERRERRKRVYFSPTINRQSFYFHRSKEGGVLCHKDVEQHLSRFRLFRKHQLRLVFHFPGNSASVAKKW